MLTHLFVYTQNPSPTATLSSASTLKERNRNAVEEVFLHGAKVEVLAMGLVYFMGQMKMFGAEVEFMDWAVGVAKDTLKGGIDVMAAEY